MNTSTHQASTSSVELIKQVFRTVLVIWILSYYFLQGSQISNVSFFSLLKGIFTSTPYYVDFFVVCALTVGAVGLIYLSGNHKDNVAQKNHGIPLWVTCGTLFLLGLFSLLLSGDPVNQSPTTAAYLLAISTGIISCYIAKSSRAVLFTVLLLVFVQSIYSFNYYIAGKNVLQSGEVFRAGGTFFDTNQLYTLMVVMIPIGFAAALRSKNQWMRFFYLLTTGSALATLVITFYRGGTFALFVSLCWMAWQATRSKKTVTLSLLLLSFLLLFTVHYRSKGQVNGSSVTRSDLGHYRLWQKGVSIFMSHPIVGVGSGNFEATVVVPSNDGASVVTRSLGEPKNVLLFYFCELGLVGGLLFLLVASSVLSLLSDLRRKNSIIGLGLECAWIALLVAGVFDTTFGPGGRYIGNCCVGLLLGLTQLAVRESKDDLEGNLSHGTITS